MPSLDASRRPPPSLPFHVVTGFLGAGKTTAINRLLRARELADALVVVNELGEIGLDHLVYERLTGDAVLLTTGCVCCALRGDLVDCLGDLLARRDAGALPAFSRIVLETTGIADPAPILFAILADAALARRLTLAGVTTLVDAVNGLATLPAQPENARQIALADRIALTKSDLLPAATRAATLGALRAAIREVNPAAPILDAAAGEFAAAEFLAAAAPLAFDAPPREARHASGLATFSLRSDAPIDPAAFSQFLTVLARLLGPRLLRVKGLVALADRPQTPLVLHGAQHVFHAPETLARWPSADHATRIVVIGEGIARGEIEALWAALTGAPRLDAPDLSVLVDNPLAPRAGGLLG